jgi:hypothetical protein
MTPWLTGLRMVSDTMNLTEGHKVGYLLTLLTPWRAKDGSWHLGWRGIKMVSDTQTEGSKDVSWHPDRSLKMVRDRKDNKWFLPPWKKGLKVVPDLTESLKMVSDTLVEGVSRWCLTPWLKGLKMVPNSLTERVSKWFLTPWRRI